MPHASMHYLGWFDASKKTLEAKIRDAIERYQDRFEKKPTHVLVDPTSVIEYPGVRVIAHPVIAVRPHHFLVGREEVSV